MNITDLNMKKVTDTKPVLVCSVCGHITQIELIGCDPNNKYNLLFVCNYNCMSHLEWIVANNPEHIWRFFNDPARKVI